MVKELKVTAIENGTVIDHIPSNSIFEILKVLDLYSFKDEVLVGFNLVSGKMGNKKGVLKISNLFLNGDDMEKVAIVAGNVTVNTIKNYEVVNKSILELPNSVKGIVKCFNPNCITNHEKITTKFDVISKQPIVLRCKYCERNTEKENIKIL